MKQHYVLPIAMACSALYSDNSFSQQNQTAENEAALVERITVVSNFREIELQQLAASATVVSQDDIRNRQSEHLDDLLKVVPNVNFASGASRGRFVQIRGIGERSQFSEPSNPSVSFEFDDINLTGLFGLATPFDVEQIEVLRGPQATEFGVGSLAGAIRFVSSQPGADRGNQVLLSLAEQNSYRLGVAYGDDISDTTGFRFSWLSQGSDGDIENSFLDTDDTDNIRENVGRIAFSSQLSNTTKLVINYRYFDIDNGYDAFSLDNDQTTRSDQPGFDRNQTHALSVRSDTDMQDFDLSFIASRVQSELDYGYDEDWTFTGFHPNGYTSFDAYFRDIDVTTIELRAVSTKPVVLGGKNLDWIVGALHRQRDEDLLREYTFASSDFSSQFDPTQLAFFAQVDVELSDQMNAQFGVRAERSEIDYEDNSGFIERSSDNLFGGKIGLSYQLDDGLLYSSISRGYKLGGFNPDERVTNDARIYQPEYNWNYEIGVKHSVLDGTGRVRAAIFYMRRQDTQVSDFDVLIREDGTPDFIDIIGNADVGTNKGIELESTWSLTDSWLLVANFGYLDASFSNYTRADGTLVERQEQAQAPRRTANLVSEFTFSEQLNWRFELDGKDDYRFSDSHNVRSRGYVLVNTSLNWDINSWQIQLWAKNLFDKEYTVRGFGGFSNDPRDGEFGYETPEPYFQFGTGRRIGVTTRYLF